MPRSGSITTPTGDIPGRCASRTPPTLAGVCIYYVLRPTTASDRARVSDWDRPPTDLDWSVERDNVGPSVALHACDMIRDWERPSGWNLPKELRSALHADVATLLRELDGPLELTATWIGDSIETEIPLTRADLLTRILANRIANRTAYIVG
jgi:hypothetical protein